MGSRARLGVVLAEPPLGQRVRTPGSQQHAVTVLRGRAPAAQAPRPRSHGAQTVCTGLSGLNYMLVIKRALREHVDALFIQANGVLSPLRTRIAEFALRNRLPTVSQNRSWVVA